MWIPQVGDGGLAWGRGGSIRPIECQQRRALMRGHLCEVWVDECDVVNLSLGP